MLTSWRFIILLAVDSPIQGQCQLSFMNVMVNNSTSWVSQPGYACAPACIALFGADGAKDATAPAFGELPPRPSR